jgi:hypothetical protein
MARIGQKRERADENPRERLGDHECAGQASGDQHTLLIAAAMNMTAGMTVVVMAGRVIMAISMIGMPAM